MEEMGVFLLVKKEQVNEEANTLVYRLPPDSDPQYETSELTLLIELNPPNSHFSPSYVAIGSHILAIGGSLHEEGKKSRFYADIYVIDMFDLEKGWRAGPKLISARGEAYGFDVAGTLCVLGGKKVFNCHPYGEVIDFNSFEAKMLRTVWKCPISPPAMILAHAVLYYKGRDDLDDPDIQGVGDFSFVNSQESGEDEVIISLDSSDCLFYLYKHQNCNPIPKEIYVLGNDDSLYCYRFPTGDWVVVEDNFGVSNDLRLISKPAGACENDVMYLVSTTLVGYSLTKRQWFNSPVSGFQDCPDAMPRLDGNEVSHSCLVNLGNGVLCVLWTSCSTTMLMNLYCTKFTITVEENDEGQLSGIANVKFHGVYTLPKARLLDCLAVSNFSKVKFPFMEQHCESSKVSSRDLERY